ncbi:hypothetical protein AMTR_s00099p00082310 [Amborella trichopoda]|uniref:Uncharacterized protein n=1 Tax=Amborella trichopoda TaxID=13333 RepID=W1NRV9_AMBTC|nr:hypothetical protein AMTR_s00099p00082310 [Amborella trichopoda]
MGFATQFSKPIIMRCKVDVVGAPLLTLECTEVEKPPPSSSPTASGLKAVDGGCFLGLLWLKLILVITDNMWLSTIMYQRLIDSWSKMYPLLHRRAARKSCSVPRPSFDLLAIDPLAIVVIKRVSSTLNLRKRNMYRLHWKRLRKDSVAAEVDVKEQGLALVELEVSPPLSVIHQEVGPLML